MDTAPLPERPEPGNQAPDAGLTPGGTDELFQALYRELHQLAERQLRQGGRDLTLGPTTLLHEAYLTFAGQGTRQFEDRGAFMAYAARAMRSLMIDYFRRSRAQKRGGGAFAITLSEIAQAGGGDAAQETARLEELSAALDELALIDAPLAQLVDLRFFCGFSLVEIADLRGVSERTVQRDWRNARMLLHRLLSSTQ